MKKQFKHIIFAALALASLAGCDAGSSNSERDPAEFKSWLIQKTQDGVKARLRDPSSAEFTDVHTTTYQGADVVCGYVNAKNGFGGKTGSQKFVGVGDTIFLEEEGSSAVNEAWTTMGC
jgi:hypothetical protein